MIAAPAAASSERPDARGWRFGGTACAGDLGIETGQPRSQGEDACGSTQAWYWPQTFEEWAMILNRRL
ncbi:MAG: hypothetical protein ACXWO3_11030, partial [Isosphaeraceae bacterium]